MPPGPTLETSWIPGNVPPQRPGLFDRAEAAASRAIADSTIFGNLYQQFLAGRGYDPDVMATRVPLRFDASPTLHADYRQMTENRGVMPVPGGQLYRRPVDALPPEGQYLYASDWERLDAGEQAAYRAMSDAAMARYADWRADFEARTAMPLDRSSTLYSAIRGREDQLIDYFRSRGISDNKKRGIGSWNPLRSY